MIPKSLEVFNIGRVNCIAFVIGMCHDDGINEMLDVISVVADAPLTENVCG